MTPRAYDLGRRAESAAETRRRIVEATYALHLEQGIVATTMKHIARRADVSVGTVYHHFPTYHDVVRACGRHTTEISRAPTPEIFTGIRSRSRRVERLVSELFAYYARFPVFERARCDRDKLAVLAESVARKEQAIAALVREALVPLSSDERLVWMATALTDFAVYRSLINRGLSAQEAAAGIAAVIVAWLKRAWPRRSSSGAATKGAG